MDYAITRVKDSDELYHYGVLGMKWGKRNNYYGTSGNKFKASNGVTVGAPKNAGVAAFRKVQGSKIGGAALNGFAKANTAIYGRGKNKTAYRKMEERVRKENQAVRESNKAHKEAIKAHKSKIEDTYKDIKSKESFKEKVFFNDATRRRAAKYVVDNNMTVEQAKKRAHKDAHRNTAILIGAYGALSVANFI